MVNKLQKCVECTEHDRRSSILAYKGKSKQIGC